ncbi:MAG: thiamine-phosphate kinase [Verrucomicrobiota bacterium]
MNAPATLADLGEAELLRLLTRGWPGGTGGLAVGAGDDCAVLQPGPGERTLLFKTDAVVEGVHFLPAARPGLVGRKALARNLSDLAAMGGEPWAALVTLAAPSATSVQRVRAVYRGLEQLARQHGVLLAGGETVRAPKLMLSVALLGRMPRGVRPVLRGTARAGDELWVTGRLGGSQGGRHLRFEPRLAAGQWLARRRRATAMMDLSDGLGADLPKLAAASGLGYELDETALPGHRGVTLAQIFNDGEDYELLFTARPGTAAKLRRDWPFADLPLTRIGRLTKKALAGSRRAEQRKGYDHFSRR